MDQEKISAKSSAKDVFSYLLMIIMLYVGVISFMAMLWQYINVLFPDPLEFYYTQISEIIRTSISALLIVWPVFIFVNWLIGRDIRREHNKKDVWIRKWLLYLTIFVASLTMIIDLITLTNSFLSGELTGRFALKVLVILLVAAGVFSYYLWELRRDPTQKTQVTRYMAIGTAIVILVSIVAGFFIVGTPAEQRARRMDEERVRDLSSIQAQVLNYWQMKGELPEDLSALHDPLYGYEAPVDPHTDAAYEYRVDGELAFSLCATFETAGEANEDEYYPRPRAIQYAKDKQMNIWQHEAGRVCFDRRIDPELYRQEDPVPVLE